MVSGVIACLRAARTLAVQARLLRPDCACIVRSGLGQAEGGAEKALAASHLSRVGLVVVAGEVKQAVEDEDLEFRGQSGRARGPGAGRWER